MHRQNLSRVLTRYFIVAAAGIYTLTPPALCQDASPASQPVKHRRAVAYVPPPANGSPHDVVPGATRGNADLPTPLLYVPLDHVGLTTKEQPVLYFYIPKTTTNQVAITLIDTETNDTISAPLLDGIKTKGMQRFDVAATGHSLKPGATYNWTVSVRASSGGPSHNAFTSAFIQYLQPNADLKTKLAGKDADEQAAIYGEGSIWFDALAAEVDAMKANPNDAAISEQFRQTLVAGNCAVNAADAVSGK